MEKVKIVFEDQEIMVVDKPAFMVTTKERKKEINTLEDQLRETKKNKLPRNGIIHRLDKGTSGLILVAKTEKSFEELRKQFKNRTVKKRYYCLVGGDTSFEGSIEMPIGRSKYGFGKFAVNVDGKRAKTEFKLIGKYKKEGKIYSLLEVDLKTGRTHQIRVHLSYLRWPLVGDRLYGGEKISIGRPFLHAHQISFFHPITGQLMTFESELPEDLKNTINEYEKI
jgi:23S rRNA pseudouridine1911/1915/1917 synthase